MKYTGSGAIQRNVTRQGGTDRLKPGLHTLIGGSAGEGGSRFELYLPLSTLIWLYPTFGF
jgi:hypothetical protein